MVTLTTEHVQALVDQLAEQQALYDHLVIGFRGIIRDLLAQQGLLEVVLSEEDSRYGAQYDISTTQHGGGTVCFRLIPKRIEHPVGP